MKSIAQIIHQNKFPLYIIDSNSKIGYYEDSRGFWAKQRFNEKGQEIYYENSIGIVDYEINC